MQTRMFLVYVISVQFLITYVLAASRNAPCVTPNRENGKCIPVKSCLPALHAIQSGDSERIKFAQKLQCGYDTVPLVCCSLDEPIFEHALLPNKNSCGIDQSTDRIVGGDSTGIDEYPWLVLLRYRNKDGEDAGFRCGGSLITDRHILTAAHCTSVSGKEGLILDSVRLGEWRISTDTDCVGRRGFQTCTEPALDVGVQRSIKHSRYNRRTKEHDIALIRLRRSVKFSNMIQPVCIPPPDAAPPSVGTSLLVAGWGLTENGSTSDVKLKVAVPTVSISDCKTRFGSRGVISDNHICAGGLAGKDACEGDSGGPLMRFIARDGNIQWIQEGIVSWGVKCGFKGYPGVYTRVSKYAAWITDNMSNI